MQCSPILSAQDHYNRAGHRESDKWKLVDSRLNLRRFWGDIFQINLYVVCLNKKNYSKSSSIYARMPAVGPQPMRFRSALWYVY